MTLTPEALYVQLGQLAADAPDLNAQPMSEDARRWLGRLVVLVEAVGGPSMDAAELRAALMDLEPTHWTSGGKVNTIMLILYRALARAELHAPAAIQGAFIPAGNAYDAFAAVGKVLGVATADVLIVDPYADEKLVSHYALQTPEKVSLRILADQKGHKPTLKPAAQAWVKQFGSLRPLEVRLAPAGSLHDRLIIVDRSTTYGLGQSFNKLAERSPTSLVRTDPETANLKIANYEGLWQSAQPL